MPSVDRSKTSPYLLRCFIRPQTHSDIQQFNPNSPALQRGEYGIYVWKDTTLRELVILLRSVGAAYQRPGNAKFSIRHVYTSSPSSSDSVDPRGPTYNYKDLGFVFARDLTGEDFLEEKGPSGRGGGRNDPSIRTLEQHRIIPGDYIEIVFITAVPTSSSTSALNPSATSSIPSLNARQPLPGGSYGPLAGRMNGLSDADKAWGIAGDQTGRRRPGMGGPMRTGGPNGAQRVNPLLSGSNGRPVGDRRDAAGGSSQGGISIMGAGRRASMAEDSQANGSSRDRRDDDRPSRRRDDDDQDMRY